VAATLLLVATPPPTAAQRVLAQCSFTDACANNTKVRITVFAGRAAYLTDACFRTYRVATSCALSRVCRWRASCGARIRFLPAGRVSTDGCGARITASASCALSAVAR